MCTLGSMFRSGSRSRLAGTLNDLDATSACHSYIGQICTQYVFDISVVGTVPDVFNGRQRLAETQLSGRFEP